MEKQPLFNIPVDEDVFGRKYLTFAVQKKTLFEDMNDFFKAMEKQFPTADKKALKKGIEDFVESISPGMDVEEAKESFFSIIENSLTGA